MRISSLSILLGAIALSGCNGANTNVNSNSSSSNANANSAQNFKPPQPIKPVEAANPNFKPCNSYFPLVPGSIAKYVINYPSGIVGDLIVVVDAAADEGGRKVFTQRSQLVDRSGGMQIIQSIVRKFVCDADRVQILSERTESNVAGQQSAIDFEYRENSVMMADPQSISRKGTTWTHALRQVINNPGQPPTRSDQLTFIAFEVMGPEEATTAAGTFKAVKIFRKIGESSTVDHYVPGLGLVKRLSKEGASWELKEYSGLKALD